MSLYDRVQSVVATELDLPLHEISPESLFVDDLGVDSLDTVELVMAFEEEFDIEIFDDEADKLMTPQCVVDFLKLKGFSE